MRTANPHENTKQPRLPRLTPLAHPQPVSPLQQQRPLVGDGTRLWGNGWGGIDFVLSLLKHPFTAFGRASHEWGSGRRKQLGHAASPFTGKLAAKRTEGVLAYRRVAPCNQGLRNAPVDNARVRPSPPVIPDEAVAQSGTSLDFAARAMA
jgi:hypothetical protein